MIEKYYNPLGEVRCQDLEQMISSLEEERNKHISHIMTLEEKMSDLEVQCASLDARLNQRTTQLSDLQREITEKANEVIALEREVCSFYCASFEKTILWKFDRRISQTFQIS